MTMRNTHATRHQASPKLHLSRLGLMLKLTCNICGSDRFKPYGVPPRPSALCCECGSAERHRALHFVLKEKGLLHEGLKGYKRCLQLAPEKVTYSYIHDVYGSGYYVSDLAPQKYRHAQCLQFELPDDFMKIPNNYFFLVLHNHVLEHIPGPFTSHVDQFYRILEEGGSMVFTIPDQYVLRGIKSVEGGEDLETDEERLALFGQVDHYKLLGIDFVEYLRCKFSLVELLADSRDEYWRQMLAPHNAKGLVFYCQK